MTAAQSLSVAGSIRATGAGGAGGQPQAGGGGGGQGGGQIGTVAVTGVSGDDGTLGTSPAQGGFGANNNDTRFRTGATGGAASTLSPPPS